MGFKKYLLGITVLCLALPSVGKAIALPPSTQGFNSVTLPGGDWTFITNGFGRIQVVADTDLSPTMEFTPASNTTSSSSGSTRMRGNVYLATNEVFVTDIAMYLGRVSATPVIFSVYESATSLGVYTLLSSNETSLAQGTNYAGVSSLSIPLEVGKYYFIGAHWNASVDYFFDTSANPYQTHFGTAVDNIQKDNAWPPILNVTNTSSSPNGYLMEIGTVDSGQIRMDDGDSDSGTSSTNQMLLTADLAGYTNIYLEFRHRPWSDEDDLEDGVFVSTNGVDYVLVQELTSAPSFWMDYMVDLDVAAASNGVSLGTPTYIKFQQMDNFPYAADGREFDDIALYTLVDWDHGPVHSESALFRGLATPHSLSVTSFVTERGMNFAFPTATDLQLDVFSAGNKIHTETFVFTSNFEVMQVTTSALVNSLTFAPGFKLSNVLHSIQSTVNTNGDDGNGANNTNAGFAFINHYSGNLLFDDVLTKAWVTNWTFQPGFGLPIYSPVKHKISGTGIVGGIAFQFDDLAVEKNLGSLNYTVDMVDTNTIYVDATNQDTVVEVDYIRPNGVTLNKTGGWANVRLTLPAGLGWTSNANSHVLSATLYYSGISVNSTLDPNEIEDLAGTKFFCEESKPVFMESASVKWYTQNGRFELTPVGIDYVRGNELNDLEAAVNAGFVPPGQGVKKSNEQYWRWTSVASSNPNIYTGPAGEALLELETIVTTGKFTAHFPYDVFMEWVGGGTIYVTNDLVVQDSVISDPMPITVPYLQSCPDGDCGAPVYESLVVTSNVRELRFTMDGGLHVAGTFTGVYDLSWGYIPGLPDYSQKSLAHDVGTYHMPGHAIRGDFFTNTSVLANGPALLLLSGVMSNDVWDVERPYGNSYSNGLADYAGVNLYVNLNGNRDGQSVLGGQSAGPWQLTARSKYYARQSGVSGIQEAVPGTFPSSMTIYGYELEFSNYGLNYLSNSNRDSRTDGVIDLPYPAAFTQAFEELNFSCLGALEGADIPENDTDKNLEYWDADFTPYTIAFVPDPADTCNVTNGFVTFGIGAFADHIPDLLYAVIGVENTGDLIAEAMGINQVNGEPLDSRFSLPNSFEVDGPSDEVYQFMPSSRAYLNDHSKAGAVTNVAEGFFSFAGTMDVPFFEDAMVHFYTGAGTDLTSRIFMMGGWPDAGWEDAGDTYFNYDSFDDENQAWPAGVFANVDDYRDQTDENYAVTVHKEWLGVVSLKYPLRWSNASKSFESFEPVTSDLLVLQVEHQVDYLSAENTELTFGLTYGDLPSISIASMVVNAVDEVTGVGSAFISGVTETVVDALSGGLDELDRVVEAKAEILFDEMFAVTIDPVIDDLYLSLQANFDPTIDYYSSIVDQYIQGQVGAPATNIQTVFSEIATGFGDTAGLIDDVDEALTRVQLALGSVGSKVTLDPETLVPLIPADYVSGILFTNNSGVFTILADLTDALFVTLSTNLAIALNDALDEKISVNLEELQPTLDALRESIGELQVLVSNAQAAVQSGQEFAQEISDAVDPSAISNVTAAIAQRIKDEVGSYEVSINPFEDYTPEEIKLALRVSIEDEFYASLPVQQIQSTMRAWLYDLEAQINEAVDSVFAQVNEAVRDIASEYLAEIDDSINGFLEDLEEVMGAGQIDGYAHINGDTLQRLRLDMAVQWNMPDAFEFKGYLIIEDLDSDGSSGCQYDGGNASEVTIGAIEVPVNWGVGEGLAFDVEAKFAFDGDGLAGMGGSIDMAQGSINFEAIEITELSAAVMFGLYENYLAASVRALMSSFEVAGGIFFGRTCSMDPIELIDPEVAAVLGEPPFSGAYVYGEGWMPIVDYGCVFNISAGVGAGFFYFVEGPTYGAKMLMGAKGEALCVVSVRGEVSMVGVKSGDSLSASGKGKISGKAGACPFCVKFKKTVTVMYKDGSWDVDY